ncbi:MAG TPA: FxLYD domain-containing protein [Bryobacteraceae bacterium]|nr:FxLYD domain-containing protein [Bryobacteraceae bacterium]
MASKPVYYVIAIIILLGAGVWGYTQYLDRHNTADLPLTPEAKLYTRNLQLSDVELKAKENYFQQAVVEIDGKIANTGPRPLDTVEIYCVFRDPYGQLVLRRRLSIVNGGLKPGETKSFRLPFDDLPQSWNQSMPQLVIAGVKFS